MNDFNEIPSFGLFDDDEYPTGHEIPSTGPADPTPAQWKIEAAQINSKKSFVGTGMTELMPGEGQPRLKGDILFCHGYHSSPLHNEEGTLWNAVTNQDPDDPGFFTKKGENADEYNHDNPDDMYTNKELAEDLPQEDRAKDAAIRKALANDGFMMFSDARQHWNYWNRISNKFAATNTYARYFNATGREHYINGSHGMGSAANHRLDHGIVLGYSWAQGHWDIFDRTSVENNSLKLPSLVEHSPAWNPVSVVGHSQGCATAIGVVLGVLRYAMDLKWEQIPINIILLGVHQNYGFSDETYSYEDDVLAQKAGKYEIANADFWDGYPQSPMFEGADNVSTLFNGLSDVFAVSNHRRGIDQHGEAITNDWAIIKGRAVQFTFANDRADMVFRDGDIRGLDCAGNPEPDPSFLSVEFFPTGQPVAPQSSDCEEVPITAAQSGGRGGTLTIPCYAINKRVIFKDITDLEVGELWKDHQIPAEWTDYRSLAIEWAQAFDRFTVVKEHYETEAGRWTDQIRRRGRRPPSEALRKAHSELQQARREMIYTYGRIHEAELYAHFSPVSLISDAQALSDWGGARTPGDSVGTTGSVWERIKAVKAEKFYRVDYLEKPDKMRPKQKRQEEKTYVEGDGKSFLIPTNIVETDHITNIIDEHVLNPDPQSIWERIKEWRYKKDWF